MNNIDNKEKENKKENKKININKLLTEFKSGNKKVLDEILKNFTGNIESKILKYNISGMEKDDFYQEAYLVIYDAIESYDKEKNNNFYAYADLLIERKFIVLLKASQRQKNLALTTSVSLDRNIRNRNDDEDFSYFLEDKDNTLNNEIEEISRNEKLEELKQKLSKNENKILDEYLKGYKYIEIANRLNITEKVVDNALQRIRRKAKTKE